MADKEAIDLDEMPVVTLVTPSQGEAMTSTKAKSAAPAAAAGAAMGTHAKLAHILAIIVAGTIAVAVATVLADGTSVIRLKDPQYLPVATNPEYKSIGLNHRLDVLLGPTYGVGLHHDQSGHSWTNMAAGSTLKELTENLGVPVIIAALPSVISTDDLKHPVPFLKCDQLQMAGLAAVSLGFIAEITGVLMLIMHTLMLAGLLPSKFGKPLASLLWFVLAVGFLTVIYLAIGVYTATWTCDNVFIPKIKLSDHFNYNYGFGFAIIGFLASLLMFLVTVSVTSTKDGTAPVAAPGLCMVILTVVCGLGVVSFVGAFGGMFVAAANGAYAPPHPADDVNICEGKKPYHAGPGDNYFSNVDCMRDTVAQVLEQAGANVTKGYRGGLDAGDRVPITGAYADHGLCPVNVHWHLGAEHLSAGEFDEMGTGPAASDHHRALGAAGAVRLGYQCRHYDAAQPKFTTPYNWQHCVGMEVGQTYEIHWPHSAAGACGTKYQMQTPFYDGVFCKDGVITIAPLNTYEKIGVQSQVFTIVNDDDPALYNGDLINGMIVDSTHGADMAMYTGSTTGTSRDNVVCSRYTPITWQVDRKCHQISASSFDKLCKDMKNQADDMSGDLHAHGARALVANHLTADNQQSRK